MPDDEKPANDVLKDLTIIKPIRLDDAHGAWVFEPQPDITALEAVLISHMFDAIAIRHLHGKFNRWDWREYLTRDREMPGPPIAYKAHSTAGIAYEPTTVRADLARHFKAVDN
jgi:hypothetical protein